MDWQAVQAVAELVAAAAVILSLVYLSIQVKQNTQSIRVAASQDLLTSFNAVTSSVSTSRHGARVYHRLARGDWESLDEEETSAARMMLAQIMRVFEQAFLQHRVGSLPDDVWEGWVHQMTLAIGYPGMLDGWPAIRQMLNRDFAELIDSLAEDAPRMVSRYAESWSRVGVATPERSTADDGGAA